ncbi:radical SAM/CxCxxxxC motif protein YfkAB [Brevibacillus sp. SYP-B805]|uniref:radical SAM/CxCxxxxC motif protein YfkAB n=1 Tax=Brevibacillus sp. SYP-B805 TaxID=1578199 RepID=UPI0013EBF737|nr:radical SAM/CxCxxxxC motif protein YfkAB [Brevibacillus sp. SYP-B805]NGQ97475.1 radical SAM/CxCxxxxC motif protein YfkAB [Brevibacillus sp. SYP-B805]
MVRLVPTTPLTPTQDPWEPLYNAAPPSYKLTSVEFTVTNLCNLRCEHCAVGDTLRFKDDAPMPMADILRRLDEAEDLLTLSITGGEPMYSERTVKEIILPLLRYAAERGLRTQINSNMTMPFSRYELILPYLDVMHISWNWSTPEEFHSIVYAKTPQQVSLKQAENLFQTIVTNVQQLSKEGVFVSAETMINARTWRKLPELHRQIHAMGCRRHEVHPMYPSDFARDLEVLSLDQLREAIHRLLDERNEEMWMLFGTLPFFACSPLAADRELIRRLREARNVSVRNDPDGRNRLNVNVFTGDGIVTDFGDVEPLGNLKTHSLQEMFQRWLAHPLNQQINCYCPEARCAGPNLLVKHAYYPTVSFKERKALV